MSKEQIVILNDRILSQVQNDLHESFFEILSNIPIGAPSVQQIEACQDLISIHTRREVRDFLLPNSRQRGFRGPAEYIFFNFCLSALQNHLSDARCYLDNSLQVLGLDTQIHEFFVRMINEDWLEIDYVRDFLVILANAIQPTSASDHVEGRGEVYRQRFQNYRNLSRQIRFNESPFTNTMQTIQN